MVKVYISAPLFTDAEREYCLRIDEALREGGFITYLPQRDGADADPTKESGRLAIYRNNLDQLRDCDAVLALLDGSIADDGVAYELGVAAAWAKPSAGLLTDRRKTTTSVNLMLTVGLSLGCATALSEAVSLLGALHDGS